MATYFQTPMDVNLKLVDGSAVPFGQRVMEVSFPVALASDQSPIPVTFPNSATVSATQGTSPWVVSGTLSTTPSGTQDVNLLKVNGAAFALGQTTMTASLPVTLANDQTNVNVSVQNASIAVTGTVTTSPPANATTNVTQWNSNTVDTNTGAASAGTLRTVLASGQIGTAGSPAAGVLSVQGVAGGIGISVKLSDGGGNAISSTTSALDVNLKSSSINAASNITQWNSIAVSSPLSLASDGQTSPTSTPAIAAGLIGYNGATWDRLLSTTVNGLDVDVTRVIPGTGATNLGKGLNDPHGANDTGVMALGYRRDTGTGLVDTTGDYTPFTVDIDNKVWVAGTELDAAAFSFVNVNANTQSRSINIAGVVDETNHYLLEGTRGMLRMTPERALRVAVTDILTSKALKVQIDQIDPLPTAILETYGKSLLIMPGPEILSSAANETALTVSTSAIKLVTANANRKCLIISNNSTGNLYIGKASTVTTSGATMGVVVPAGFTYTDSGYGLYQGELWGIYSLSASSQNIAISDRI